MGIRTGLNYAGVEAVMRMMGMEGQREVFEALQVIEWEILQMDEERRAEEAGKQRRHG